jgi:rhamnosyltransferase subunit B
MTSTCPPMVERENGEDLARIVVTSLGSLGDLYPMMPVAQKLREHGHQLVFAVPAHLEPAVLAEGYDCSPISIPSFPKPARGNEPPVEDRIKQRFPTMLRGALAALESVCGSADLLITHQLQVAAAITAQKFGLKWVTLTVFPGFIPSSYTVPQPHWLPALPGPPGRLVNRTTWRIFNFGIRHLSGDVLDQALEAHGVKRNSDIFAPGGLSPYLALVLSSPLYSPRQPDWPAHVKVVGYTHWDEPIGWTDPADLNEFLDEGEPPVLVTTSSAGERDAAAFFDAATRALEQAGRRGLLLLGSSSDRIRPEPGTRRSSGVAAWPYLPLSRVVGRCALVIHHSGIGTALTTIRHGKACVAVPATFDQWYNAGRIKSLGVGRLIEWKRFSIELLAAEVDRVTTTTRYAQKAVALGAAMAEEDGATRACDEIEALLGE